MDTIELTEKLKGLKNYSDRLPAHYESNYYGLNVYEQILLYIIHRNKFDEVPNRRRLIKEFSL